ncbi:MAG: alpha/beta hydrolase [Tenericutes bacterium]|nr:alpha/beta hydrolase [Mycoplasmatota bacterium]
MPWLIPISVVIVLVLFVGGLYIAFRTAKPPRRSLLETSVLEEEYLNGIMDFYRDNTTSEYIVKTRDGLSLQAYFLKNNLETNKYIVMSHGHTYTHHGCLKYARMMMKYGYNIVMYDHRYHGNSEGNYTSLGHKEKDDLNEVITDTFNKYGSEIYLGTYGESMGSATVLLEAENDHRVKFVFSDCGFTNLSVLVEEFIKKTKYIPKWPFMYIGSFFFKLIVGSYFNGISPIKALNRITVPVFFAHGEADKYINYHHTIELHENYQGPKQLFIGKNEAFHAGSYVTDTKNYEVSVEKFVKKYLNN